MIISGSSSSLSLLSPRRHHFFTLPKCALHHQPYCRRQHLTISASFPRRHYRRRHLRKPPFFTTKRRHSSPSDQHLPMVIINVEHFSNKASSYSLESLLALSKSKFNEFIVSGIDAIDDLQSLITVDADNRVVVSCRRSTFFFMGNLVLWSFLIMFCLQFLVKLGLGLRDQFGSGRGQDLVYKRDRSLGGKLVVVGKRKKNSLVKEDFGFSNQLSADLGTLVDISEEFSEKWDSKREQKLPIWWPVLLPTPVVIDNKQEYQRMANRLIRAMMDHRITGEDILEDDIVQDLQILVQSDGKYPYVTHDIISSGKYLLQLESELIPKLRRICKTSGVKVSIDPANARDSFYRASVNFILNICGSMESQPDFIQVDGEDVRQFIAGLADNIGLECHRAARIVSAAVAARARSCFLQAWALEMQGKRHQATIELTKLSSILQMFPPEEHSPEMEMVARGLEKHLKVDQREILRDIFISVHGEEGCWIVDEALGLVH